MRYAFWTFCLGVMAYAIGGAHGCWGYPWHGVADYIGMFAIAFGLMFLPLVEKAIDTYV